MRSSEKKKGGGDGLSARRSQSGKRIKDEMFEIKALNRAQNISTAILPSVMNLN